ncbi:aegerolysin type hemolysin [Trametes maxima]|nr:aegerolysin type hemolysin [Trametes maxima]
MGYSQWVTIEIVNNGEIPIKLTRLYVEWGKLHEVGNKEIEVDPNTVNNKVLRPGQSLQFASCGRAHSSSGTTGRFSLVDVRNGSEIRHFYWDCPWGRPGNEWQITGKNKGFVVESQGANLESGALGNIIVEVVSKRGA